MLTASNGLCESRGPEGNKLAQPLRRQRLVSQSQVLLLVDSVRTSQGRPLLWPRLCLAQRLWSLTPGTQGLPCHWVFDKHRLWGQQVTDHKTFFLSLAVLGFHYSIEKPPIQHPLLHLLRKPWGVDIGDRAQGTFWFS